MAFLNSNSHVWNFHIIHMSGRSADFLFSQCSEVNNGCFSELKGARGAEKELFGGIKYQGERLRLIRDFLWEKHFFHSATVGLVQQPVKVEEVYIYCSMVRWSAAGDFWTLVLMVWTCPLVFSIFASHSCPLSTLYLSGFECLTSCTLWLAKPNYKGLLTFQKTVIHMLPYPFDHHCSMAEDKIFPNSAIVVNLSEKDCVNSMLNECRALERRSAETDMTPNASHSGKFASFSQWTCSSVSSGGNYLRYLGSGPPLSVNTLPPSSGHWADLIWPWRSYKCMCPFEY